MNAQNYASLEASKRLAEAGIVLETDWYWYHNNFHDTDELVDEIPHYLNRDRFIPAPSMAEVWRELPNEVDGNELFLMKGVAHYSNFQKLTTAFRVDNANPTDALIDLLIWVKKEAHHDR